MPNEYKKISVKIDLAWVLTIICLFNLILLNIGNDLNVLNILLHWFSVLLVYVILLVFILYATVIWFMKRDVVKEYLDFSRKRKFNRIVFNAIQSAIIVFYFYYSSTFFSSVFNAIHASVFITTTLAFLLTPTFKTKTISPTSNIVERTRKLDQEKD